MYMHRHTHHLVFFPPKTFENRLYTLCPFTPYSLHFPRREFSPTHYRVNNARKLNIDVIPFMQVNIPILIFLITWFVTVSLPHPPV